MIPVKTFLGAAPKEGILPRRTIVYGVVVLTDIMPQSVWPPIIPYRQITFKVEGTTLTRTDDNIAIDSNGKRLLISGFLLWLMFPLAVLLKTSWSIFTYRSYIIHTGPLHHYEMQRIIEATQVLLAIPAFGVVFWMCYKYGFGQFQVSLSKPNKCLLSGSGKAVKFDKIKHIAISSKWFFGRQQYSVEFMLINLTSDRMGKHLRWLETMISYQPFYVGLFRNRENAEFVAGFLAEFMNVQVVKQH